MNLVFARHLPQFFQNTTFFVKAVRKISWTMPLTIEIWLGLYMIWCRGFKLQDWPFRGDHSSLIYEFHQNHTLCISWHYRAKKCQVELQGMISLKLGIPVSVPAICGTSVSMFISTVPGKSSPQMIKLPSMTFSYVIHLLSFVLFWLNFKFLQWFKQLCCGYCLCQKHNATLVFCTDAKHLH